MKELRWAKRDRVKKLLIRLGPIPHEAGLQAVVTTAAMSDYRDLIVGTEAERLFKAYIIALIDMIHLISDNIPPDDTFKLVLEVSERYSFNVRSLFRATGKIVTPDGRKKLSSIESVDKGTTHLTEPADYLAFALLEQSRHPGSEKHLLCRPILENKKTALVRQREQSPDSVRNMLIKARGKFPNLFKKNG
jgi:hypothetical protein